MAIGLGENDEKNQQMGFGGHLQFHQIFHRKRGVFSMMWYDELCRTWARCTSTQVYRAYIYIYIYYCCWLQKNSLPWRTPPCRRPGSADIYIYIYIYYIYIYIDLNFCTFLDKNMSPLQLRGTTQSCEYLKWVGDGGSSVFSFFKSCLVWWSELPSGNLT